MRRLKARMPSVVTVIRVVSLCVFLFTTISISVSWMSLSALLVLLVSIYAVDYVEHKSKAQPKFVANPLKGKPKLSSLTDSREKDVNAVIGKHATDYDPQHCVSLESFEAVKQGSECIFARKAKLWGARDWNSALSLEENVYRSIPMLLKFTLVCQELGLDGFLFVLPGQNYGAEPQSFGQGVRRVLQTVSDLDPAGFKCMDKSYLDKRGWVFEFNRVTFFITTFAPFYPPSSSRFAHGAEDGFVLLQPEISFAQHDLPEDTGHTDWEHPVTVRDRIRTAFRRAGRGYVIRTMVSYPMAHDVVKPLREEEDPLVEWWVKAS